MLNKEVKDNFFICPCCSCTEEHIYESWVEYLAELPVIHGQFDFSNWLWNMNECPSCKRKFPSAFTMRGVPDIFSSIPFVLEWVVMESENVARNGYRKHENVLPIKEKYSHRCCRCGIPFDIIAWVGLAVASGIIGNMSYEVIKNAVLDARRKVIQKKNNLYESQNVPKISKEELQRYGRFIREWDTMSDEELEKCVELIYEYARQRLRNI
jgi:hypothetical protein